MFTRNCNAILVNSFLGTFETFSQVFLQTIFFFWLVWTFFFPCCMRFLGRYFIKQFNLSNLPQFIVQYKIPNCPNLLSIHPEKILRIWVPKFLEQHKKPPKFPETAQTSCIKLLGYPLFLYSPDFVFRQPKGISQWGCQLATWVKGIAKGKYAVWAPEKN